MSKQPEVEIILVYSNLVAPMRCKRVGLDSSSGLIPHGVHPHIKFWSAGSLKGVTLNADLIALALHARKGQYPSI